MLEECPMNLEKSSEKEQNAPDKIDNEKFVIRKALSEYWRACWLARRESGQRPWRLYEVDREFPRTLGRFP